ncbi:MAG: helix-turn-helix transcriptional regulator [Lentisphaeria bacterium]
MKLTGKTYTNVVDMMRGIMPEEKEWCDKLENNIANRQLSRTLFVMRNHAGLSQAEMAHRLGCTQSRISKLESAPSSAISHADMVAYAKALDLSLDITFHPKLNSAQAIKIHTDAIRSHLEHLANLAHSDPDIENGVIDFFRETMGNMLDALAAGARKLPDHAAATAPRPQAKAHAAPRRHAEELVPA